MSAAIIAGVGPGLGASLARGLSQEGYAVALLSRKADSCEPVALDIRSRGGRASTFLVDVTQREAVLGAVAKARQEFGFITALAYNASGFGRGGFLTLTPE